MEDASWYCFDSLEVYVKGNYCCCLCTPSSLLCKGDFIDDNAMNFVLDRDGSDD